MASKQPTVDFILEQSSGAGAVTAKKMFDEYCLYLGGKIIALVADDQLYVKITPGAKALAPEAQEAPPYPGAKNCLLISGEKWDDREWLAELFRITGAELPSPGKKPAKKKK